MMPDDFSDVFRDRQGKPCGMDRFKEIAGDEWLRHIGADIVASSRGPVYVSTIWTGIDTSVVGRGFVFETMCYAANDDIVGSARYRTLLQATIGHQRMVEHFAQSWWTNLGGLA